MQPQIIPRSEHCISRKNIDPDALKVLYRLYRSGHTAFLVGGGVRDLLIGRKPKDFDVSTSARPGQVKKLFRNCWLIGRRFRLAHIHFRDHKIIEVSTFRSEPVREEGESEDDLLVRRDNTFGTPEEDALRRDFTINGLFYDIASFSLIDYVGGVDDIEAGVIRTIGDPRIRFQEDPVRMIRAIKFAARLDFSVEPETWEALCDHIDDIRRSSTSRVMEEVARLLEGGASCRSLQLLKATGLLPIVLPEIYEYFHGIPAGPGMHREGRREVERPETADEEVLLEDHDEVGEEEGLELDETAPEAMTHAPSREGFEEEGPDEGTVYARMDAAVNLGAPHDLPEDAFSRFGPAAEGPEDEAPAAEDDAYSEDEEALIILEDEKAEGPLTPEGTRCVQAPDRGARLWRSLAAVDLMVRGGHPLTRPTLYAALLAPVVHDTAEWLLRRRDSGADLAVVLPEVLRPLTASVLISRRDRERVCQLLLAQRRFERKGGGSVAAFARKPYFAEALDLFEISVLATGEHAEALDWWRRRYPHHVGAPVPAVEPEEPRGPSGRGRGRGRGPGGGRGSGGGRGAARDFEEPVRQAEGPEYDVAWGEVDGRMSPPRDEALPLPLDEEGEGDRPRRRRRRRRRAGGGDR